jgi:hypothetical protein
MDSDDTPFMLMRYLGPMTSFLSLFASVIVTSPVILYVIARWRANRDPVPDPQLGFKFALHYFATVALNVVLVGIAMVLYAALSGVHESTSGLRFAFGLIIPAGIVLAANLVALLRTTDRVQPGVRRLFVGYNLLTSGIVAFVGFVMGCEVLFAKDGGDGLGYVAASVSLVYGGMWIALAWLMSRLAQPAAAPGVPASVAHLTTTLPEPLHRD